MEEQRVPAPAQTCRHRTVRTRAARVCTQRGSSSAVSADTVERVCQQHVPSSGDATSFTWLPLTARPSTTTTARSSTTTLEERLRCERCRRMLHPVVWHWLTQT